LRYFGSEFVGQIIHATSCGGIKSIVAQPTLGTKQPDAKRVSSNSRKQIAVSVHV